MLFIPITSTAIPQLIDQGVSDQAIRSVLIKVASKFTPILQKSAPVDTGALRRSLRVDLLPDDSGVALVSVVFYAGFVEFGTRKMRPRLYAQSLVPDIISHMNLLLSELGSFTRTEIRSVAVGEQSNQTTQTVTQDFLNRIQGNQVGAANLKPLSISGEVVESLVIPPISVAQESVDPESAPDQIVQ
jgi:HK97 gp10 family phage protein